MQFVITSFIRNSYSRSQAHIRPPRVPPQNSILYLYILLLYYSLFYFYFRHGSAHLSPQPLAGAPRLSPQHPLAAAGPLYHQTELYRRPAVYVTTTQPAYLPATHQVAPSG